MYRKIILFCILSLMSLVAHAEDYCLQQSDVIRMTIYQEDDMQTEAFIDKSGNISFPLLGSVKVKGLTTAEVEKKMKVLYGSDYLVDPKIRVEIISYAKKWITVAGAVVNPGNVPYPEEGEVNLPTAVAMAGGVSEMGNSRTITVARKKGGVVRCSLASSTKIILLPGDTVVVPQLPTPKAAIAKTATISGEVRNPGSIKLPANGKIDILTAIAQAGNYSKIANQKECILQRRGASGHKVSTVNLRNVTSGKSPMVFIYEGDIVIIKESRF